MKHCGEVFGRWRGVASAVAPLDDRGVALAVAHPFSTRAYRSSGPGCSRLHPKGYSLQERGRSICLSLGGATGYSPVTMLREEAQ
jgi:hypothetical protein